MENDDYLPQGRKGFRVLLVMTLFFLGGLGIAMWSISSKEAQESKERITLACLDKVTDKESPNYAAQLKACMPGHEARTN